MTLQELCQEVTNHTIPFHFQGVECGKEKDILMSCKKESLSVWEQKCRLHAVCSCFGLHAHKDDKMKTVPSRAYMLPSSFKTMLQGIYKEPGSSDERGHQQNSFIIAMIQE